jgi:hypothetical protein
MPTIQYGSKSIDVPEGLTDDQQLELLMDDSEGVKAPSFSNPMPSNQPVDYQAAKVDPNTLHSDAKWLESSKVLYKQHHGVDFDGTDEELANYGLNQISYFNYNTVGMAVDAVALKNAKQEEKEAFLYLMDKYDHLGISTAGALRFIGAAATDPLTYVGLSTLGLGTVAGAAGKTMGKAAIRSAIHASIEAGVQSAVQGSIKQEAKINAGGKQEFSYGELAADTALGAAFGAGIGAAAGALGAKFLKDKSGLPGSTATEPPQTPRSMSPSLFGKEAPTPADAAGDLSVGLGTSLEKASRIEHAQAPSKISFPGASEAEIDALSRVKQAADAAGEKVDLAKELEVIRQTNKPVDGSVTLAGKEYTIKADEPKDLTYKGLQVSKSERVALQALGREAKQAGEKVDWQTELNNLRHGVKDTPSDLLHDVDLGVPVDPVERIVKAVNEANPEAKMPFEPHPRADVEAEVMSTANQFVNMNKNESVAFVKKVADSALNPEARLKFNSAIRLATDQLEAKAFNLWANYKLLPDADKPAALKELAQVEKLRDNVKTADTYLSSMEGSALSQRVGSVNTGEFRGVSEESILTEKFGDPELATPAQKDWAKNEYYRIVSAYYDRAQAAAKVVEIKKHLDEAVTQFFSGGGKFEDVMKLYTQLKEEQLKAADNESKEFNLFKDSAKRVMNDVNQVIISTVFSPATLMMNTIPSLVKTVAFPALNAVIKGPTDEAAVKEMLTFYHTMYNNIGISWQMAKAAWELERSLMMTQDYGNRFMEGAQGTGILDNRLGRTIRFFPRVLTATDEFFQSLNYRGYVMGEAHFGAVRDANKAIAEGTMKASEKDAYITKKLQQASDHMFANVQDKTHLLEWTTEVGKERGLKGEELAKWVQQQLTDRGHLMKEVSSESGARYVEDLLFKRRFSGEGAMSEAAKKYEEYANNNPWMRTIGQLFFRTPVRVFEEGIRMTPGINLFAPNYLNDLRGVNGQPAQVKATREAMLGFAITHWVMAQYAAGNITGSGPTDYKQRRDMEAAGWQAYTIKTPVGDLNYRNLDPFVTPIKIITNMMEKLSAVEHEQATGAIKPGSWEEAYAMLGVSVGSVMQAVKDANLWDGLTQIWSAGEKSVDPEHSGFDKFFVHFLGQKAAYAIPSVVSKGIATQQPDMTDPASLWQYVVAKAQPNSTSVAHIHDVLGNVRTKVNPWGKLVGIQLSDENMRKAGHSDKEIAVLREIAKLGIAGKTNFTMPTKDKLLAPGVDDLRTSFTNDGKLTLYDRVNQLLKESDMTDQLYNTLVGKEHLPVSARLKAVKKIISDQRKLAFTKLWSEKSGMKEDFIANKLFEAEGQAGLRDSDSLPYLND